MLDPRLEQRARQLVRALVQQSLHDSPPRGSRGARPPGLESLAEIERVVTIFRELRSGVTADQRTTVKSPSATLSTAEAISVMTNGLSLAAHFGDGVVRADDVAAGLVGAVVKDPVQDRIVWQEYLETVVKDRTEWTDLYRACRELG